jgi:hypothetical protein
MPSWISGVPGPAAATVTAFDPATGAGVALDAGLLTHLRLDGGIGSASPDQGGQRRRPGRAMTALIGRATACFCAGKWDPERLGSAIATHAHCAERVERPECGWRAQ